MDKEVTKVVDIMAMDKTYRLEGGHFLNPSQIWSFRDNQVGSWPPLKSPN